MKNVALIAALVVALSGCAAGGGNYIHPMTNARNISMSAVASYANTVKTYLTSGTQEQAIEAAKQTVASSLKDPSGAQFRNVRLVNYLDGSVICGEVNGKNSHSGYAGFSPFVASTNASYLYDKDSKYPEIQSAANAGLNAACSTSPRASSGQSAPGNSSDVNFAPNEPGKFQWPAEGILIAGYDEVNNKGLDIGGNSGDPVYAAADGKVVFVGSGLRGYGKLIILKHKGIFVTAYAHNQNLLVTEKQAILRGQKIAEMGASDADRVKLHFEIRRNGKPVDPILFLPNR